MSLSNVFNVIMYMYLQNWLVINFINRHIFLMKYVYLHVLEFNNHCASCLDMYLVKCCGNISLLSVKIWSNNSNLILLNGHDQKFFIVSKVLPTASIE